MHSPFCLLGYCFAAFLEQMLLYNFHLPRLDIGNYSWRHWDAAGICGEKGVKKLEWPWDWSHNRHDSKASEGSIKVMCCYCLPSLFWVPFFPWLTEKAAGEMLKVESKSQVQRRKLVKKAEIQMPSYCRGEARRRSWNFPWRLFPPLTDTMPAEREHRHRLLPCISPVGQV